MATTVPVPRALRDWIRENLTRGAAPDAMVEALAARNVAPAVARGMIEAVASERSMAPASPSRAVASAGATPPYLYERPRIAPGPVIRAGDRELRVLLRLESPIAATLEGLMTGEECDTLIALATPRLRRSTVIDAGTGADLAADRRSSEGMFFRPGENGFIARLEQRFAAVANLPAEHGEGLQVLRYRPGGSYPPHFDFLLPSNPATAESLERSGQRVATLIVYLNEGMEGGETTFPEVGLAVVPRRGHALYFEYCNSRLQLDPRSAHGGATVRRGEKWIVTYWMRSRPYVPAGEAQPER